MFKYLLALFSTFFLCCFGTKLPDLTGRDVTKKSEEALEAHANHKKFDRLIAQRSLLNYLESLDPVKTYFIAPEIEIWTHPSDILLDQLISEYQNGDFSIFEKIYEVFAAAMQRRQAINAQISYSNLPTPVKAEEFKDLTWVNTEAELIDRLRRLRSLQVEAASKLSKELQETALLRMAKREAKYQEEMLPKNPNERQKLIFKNVLKSIISSLDAHSAYFTPAEAVQFMINVQQRLFGIGVQLRDDINGFIIVKIVEGSPAALEKQLKVKDRIIGVNGEVVIGMDIEDAVELIRGEENTRVLLTVVRRVHQPDGSNIEETLDISVPRGRVVLNEYRYKSSYQPFGDGVIGYLKLYSFYEDRDSSSAQDLRTEIEKMKKEHALEGLILDLRYNSGGLLTEAVAVTGLFLKNGVVVSIKDETGHIQRLRNTRNNIVWDGPLIVLINRMSASASEIVAQTLQDYGRAIIVGDDHSYGKGSYQTFTLAAQDESGVDPEGEIKITRGIYYPVGGETPQEKGVTSDIEIPGPVMFADIGERYLKYPLKGDRIAPSYKDDLSDVPIFQQTRFKKLYQADLQHKQDLYSPYLPLLKNHVSERIAGDINYQNFLTTVRSKDKEPDPPLPFGQNDLQLEQTYEVMEELLMLSNTIKN